MATGSNPPGTNIPLLDYAIQYPDAVTAMAAAVAAMIAFLALIAAVCAILATNRAARRRAALDILLDETKGDLPEKRREFTRLCDQGNTAQWALPKNANSKETAVFWVILNRFELVAIGVREKIIDEESYRKWKRTTLVNDWINTKPFTMEIRETRGNYLIFSEFQALAERWAIGEERAKL